MNSRLDTHLFTFNLFSNVLENTVNLYSRDCYTRLLQYLLEARQVHGAIVQVVQASKPIFYLIYLATLGD